MTQKQSLLIVDDEPNIRRVLQVAFEKAGLTAFSAEDAREALSIVEKERIDCVLTDVTMPGLSGYELLSELRRAHEDIPVVIMTAYGTIPQAIAAIRNGAFEFVTKPFDLDTLKKIVNLALNEKGAKQPTRTRRRIVSEPHFIAQSAVMKDIVQNIEQVADSRATVLISGESGTGKEIVAKLVHELSPRKSKPFVAVSCAALPETLLESELFGYEKGAFTGAAGAKPGRFELASGGTLFLDEIGEVPMPIQVKLLRVLQEREFERLGATKPTQVDVRLVTATNRDLHQAVEEGSFRLDLLYRLQVVELHLPALRERIDDILPLAIHFLARHNAENGRRITEIDAGAEQLLLAYRWPGNVRELENTIERAVVLAPRDATRLSIVNLPQSIRTAA